MSSDASGDIDPATWPTTVDDAAARIVDNLSSGEKTNLASLSDDDLLMQHFGMGIQIRNLFGLWGGNTQLLDDCALNGRLSTVEIENDDPTIDEARRFVDRMDGDGASQTILRAARDLARSLRM